MEEELTPELGRIIHFSPLRTSESSRDADWPSSFVNQSNVKPQDDRDSETSSKAMKVKTLTIPWNGRILSPTLTQLKEFKDDLDLIEEVIGSREPRPEEKNYRIRFTWRNFILWPTPEQLKRAKGDLNALTDICTHKLPISPSRQSFRSKLVRSPSHNSFTEF